MKRHNLSKLKFFMQDPRDPFVSITNMNRRKGVGDSSDDEAELSDQHTASSRDQQSNPPPASGDERSDGSGDEGSGEDAREADSSESESDDEDELAKVQEGFIASDSESESGSDSRQARKRRRRKRKRPSPDEPIELDEDDLDVLGANTGAQESRFKRLKRAGSAKRGGLDSIFDDNDESDEDVNSNSRTERRPRHDESEEETPRPKPRAQSKSKQSEFDDFIEADEFSEDEAEELRRAEEREIGQQRNPPGRGLALLGDISGLDEEKLSEIYDVFGDGEMYDWALAGEDELDTQLANADQDEVQLGDVFEPVELAVRMLLPADNAIRVEDVPERYQLLRQRLTHPYTLDDDVYSEKQAWIAEKLLAKKDLSMNLADLTKDAVYSVINFVSKENLEIPFIWHHRQDFLVHFSSSESSAVKTQLLSLDDLWFVLDMDIAFHAVLDRKMAAKSLADQISQSETENAYSCGLDYEELSVNAKTSTEFQDLIEYMQFAYCAAMKSQKRHLRYGQFERIKQSNSKQLIDDLACSPKAFAELLSTFVLNSDLETLDLDSVDPLLQPISHVSPFEAEEKCEGRLDDAVNYVSTALSVHPTVKRFFRNYFTLRAKIDLVVTDDGRKKITANSPFADLKYSCNWTLAELKERPALFLRMLRAMEQGLVIVRAQYPHYKQSLYASFARLLGAGEANEWSKLRAQVAKSVSRQIVPQISRQLLETLRSECVSSLRFKVRRAFAQKLNQAPFKPPGYVLGTVPRAMCISFGEGQHTDAVLAAVVDEDGHVSECVKLGDLRTAGFSEQLVQATRSARPDVVGVLGFTPHAHKLLDDVRRALVDEARLMAGPEDAEMPLQVVWVNDEVARLYRNSAKAADEFPDLVPNARYCVAGARYLQGPLYEYAQLDDAQLRSLAIHPDQDFLSLDEFRWATETAYVDYVCLDGVDINQAVRQPYRAAVLPYIAGLGPRKAQGIVQSVLARAQGGRLVNRTELITGEMTTSTVFMNCASFLKIAWSSRPEDEADYLDSTRVHPEDYELARKMCADALELDEEDVLAVEESQAGGVVVKLLDDDGEGRKLDELILEAYAKELEKTFKQRKRVTLEQIRLEIQDAYAEKRGVLHLLSPEEVFTMLSGETKQTFQTGSVVSGTVRRVTGRQLMLTLSSGIDAVAESGSISDDRSIPLNQQFSQGQAVQAVILTVDYTRFFAITNTKASVVSDALKKLEYLAASERDPAHWNFEAERRDTQLAQRRAEQRQRQLRVIKHPLFRPFSAKEAEAYLAPLQRGDLVIRPSSKGPDHLVVTWKVSEQIYQHIDVQELDKPNEYALGRTLQVGPYKYTDLDELILMHVQALVRKVDEITASEKFQKGNRKDVERWLQAYTHARPTQSVYAFCFDHRRPGYILLSYMLGANQPIRDLHVRILPNGYELLRNQYPDVLSLTNGFKMMVQRARV